MARSSRPSGKKSKKASPASKKSSGKKTSAKKKSSASSGGGPRKRQAGKIQSTGRSRSDRVAFEEEQEEEALDPREKYMSLGDHLEELRKRLLWIIGIVIGASAGFGVFSYQIHSILVQPFKAVSKYPLILGAVAGPLEVVIRLSLLLGVLTTAPIILWILWGFITPAISRKAAWIGNLAVLSSGFLFWGGVVFTWFNLFPISLQMFFQVMLMGLENTIPQTSIEKYYSFLFMVHMGAGLIFQIPLLMVALGAAGILTIEWHKKYWRIFITVVFVISAIVTPPDPLTQTILAGPIVILYALSVLIVWFIERRRRKRALVEREVQ